MSPARASAAPARSAPARERKPAASPEQKTPRPAAFPTAQRAPGGIAPCACGGTCPRCQRSIAAKAQPSSAAVSAKPPRVAAPTRPASPGLASVIENQSLEQEAVAVAEKIVSMVAAPAAPPPPPAPSTPPSVRRSAERASAQRQRTAGLHSVAPLSDDFQGAPSRPLDRPTLPCGPPPGGYRSIIRSTSFPFSLGAGEAIASSSRRWMEDRFQTDFSAVRLYRRPAASAAADHQRARAFTYGNHIVLGRDVPAVDTTPGRLILAHELVHTLQQASPYARGDVSAQALPRGPPSGVSSIQIQRSSAALGVQCLPSLDDVTGAVVSVGEGALDVASDVGGAVIDAGGAVVDFAGQSLATVVDYFAPGLMTFLSGGYAGQLTELFCSGLDSLVGMVIAPLEEIDVVSAIEQTFTSLTNGVNGLRSAIGSTASAALGTLLRPVVEALQIYGDPIIENISAVAETVEGVFSGLWNNIAVPVLDFLGRVGGVILEGFNAIASWIDRVTAPLRDAVQWAWDELCAQFDLAWESTGGIRQWLSDTTQEVYDSFLEAIEPIKTPLKIVGGALLLLSPFGPILVVTQILPPLYDKLVWLWNSWNTEEILVQAREILTKEILPGIIGTVASVSTAIAGAVSWLAGVTASLSESVGGLLSVFGANSCLTAVTRVLNHIADQFQRLAAWARGGFQGLGTAVSAVFDALVAIFQPILDFLIRLLLVAANPPLLPVVIGAAIWLLCPDDLKPPVINFVLDLILVFLRAAPSFIPGLWPLAALLKTATLGFLASLRIQTDELKIAATNKIAGLLAGGGLAFVAGFGLGLPEGIMDGILDPFVIIWMLVRLTVAATRAIGTLLARLSTTLAAPGENVRTALGAPARDPGLSVGSAFMADLGFGESESTPAARAPRNGTNSTAAVGAAAAPAPAPKSTDPEIVAHEGNTDFARLTGTRPSPPAGGAGTEAADPRAGLLDGGPLPSDAEVAAAIAPDLAADLSSSADGLEGADAEGEAGLRSALESTSGSPRRLSQMLGEAWDAALAGAANLGATVAETLLRFILQPDFKLGKQIGWAAGFILFQVILAYLTAGVTAAGQAASPILRFAVRFLDLGGEILGLLGRALGRLAGPITTLLTGAGRLVKRIPGLGSIFTRFSRAIQSLLRFSSEAGGAIISRARRVTDPLGERVMRTAGLPEHAIADVLSHSATSRAASATARTERAVAGEATGTTGRHAADEAADRTAREVADSGAERTARESSEAAAQDTRRATSDVDDVASREASHADDGERAAAREGDDAAELARRKQAEMPGAMIELRLFCEANDRIDTPVPLLIAELYAAFGGRYPWIKRFSTRRRGLPHHHQVFFEASPPHEIDSDYSDERPPLTAPAAAAADVPVAPPTRAVSTQAPDTPAPATPATPTAPATAAPTAGTTGRPRRPRRPREFAPQPAPGSRPRVLLDDGRIVDVDPAYVRQQFGRDLRNRNPQAIGERISVDGRQGTLIGSGEVPFAPVGTPRSAAPGTPQVRSTAPGDRPTLHVDYTTRPDTVPPGLVLEFPGGHKVWRQPNGATAHETTVGPSSFRRGLEGQMPGPSHAGLPTRSSGGADLADVSGRAAPPARPGYHRAHMHGQGTGFESPYAIPYASDEINLALQNDGIEEALRAMRDSLPEGAVLHLRSEAQMIPGSNRFSEAVYRVDYTSPSGSTSQLFEFNIRADGTRARPRSFVELPEVFSDEAAILLDKLDIPERAAERAARIQERLRAKRALRAAGGGGGGVARQSTGPAPSILPPSVPSALGSQGLPLPGNFRRRAESYFQADLSHVRVHADAPAARAAADSRASALAFDHHILLGARHRDLTTPATQRTLAHEVAHTLQPAATHGAQAFAPDDSPAESAARSAASSFGQAHLGPSSHPGGHSPLSTRRSAMLHREPADAAESEGNPSAAGRAGTGMLDVFLPSAAGITDPLTAIRLVGQIFSVPVLGAQLREAAATTLSQGVAKLIELNPELLAVVGDVLHDPEKYLEQVRSTVQPQIESIPARARKEAEERLGGLQVMGEPFARVMDTVFLQLEGLGANWWPVLKEVVTQQIALWDWSSQSADLAELDRKYFVEQSIDPFDYGLQVVKVALGGLDRVLGAVGIGLWLASFAGGTGIGTAGGGAVGSLAAGAGAAPGAVAGGGTGATAGGGVGAAAFEIVGLISVGTSIAADVAILGKSVIDLQAKEANAEETEEDYQLIASSIISLTLAGGLFVLGAISASLAKKLSRKLLEQAPRVRRALPPPPTAARPNAAAAIASPESAVRIHSGTPSNLVAVPRPDLGPGVDLMLPNEQLVPVSTLPVRTLLSRTPRGSQGNTPAALADRSTLPAQSSATRTPPALEISPPATPARPDAGNASPSDLSRPQDPQTATSSSLESGSVTLKEPSATDLAVEELLNGDVARDALEHPAGTALVLHPSSRPAEVASPPLDQPGIATPVPATAVESPSLQPQMAPLSAPPAPPALSEGTSVTLKEPSESDLAVEELLNGGAARDLLEHPGGTALVLHQGDRSAGAAAPSLPGLPPSVATTSTPAVAPTTTVAPQPSAPSPATPTPTSAPVGTPSVPTPALTPTGAILRTRNDAHVAFTHRSASGVMAAAGLNSEHLLPASVISRDPEAIIAGLTEASSPTIMIDEALHQAGMTYGVGIAAVIYDYDNPLQMVDAIIANYEVLLNQPRFSHLDRAKYMAGFDALRQTYLGQYPEVFDPTRTRWWED